MRTRCEGEAIKGTRTVSLAQGEAVLGVSVGGTLLPNDPIEPIVSARQLIAFGFRLIWTKRACQLFDEKGVSIPVSVVSGCPRVSQALALKLIDRIELSKLNRCSVEGACKIQPKPGTWRDSMRGLKEALDGKATDRAYVEHRTVLARLFPEVPDELVDEVSQLSSSSLPPKGFNRHRRRRISRCRSAVVHLFCGSSRHAFDHVVEKYNTAMIAVDLSEDLNDPATYQFLIQHALDGRVDVLLAGLPCRTRSALRGRGEGPPVVRGRTGPTRWGLPEIPVDEQEKVVEDDLLWVRTLAQAAAAQWGLENRFPGLGARLGFGLENPADPLEVFGQSHSMNPSLWCTPEYKTLERLLGLEQVKLDQGPLGHAIRKPSTLAVTRNMWPTWCREIRGPGIGSRKGDKSSDWAEWAPGLKQAFLEFVEAVLQRSSQSQEVVAKAVVNQSFRDHILAGHVPFRKDCYSCVAGRSKKGSHFRQDISEAFVLSLDLAGPLPAGEHEKSKARYFLAASFSVPVDPRINGSQETEAPEDPHEPEAVGWDLDLEEEESEVVQEPDSLPAAAEAEQLEELKLAHLPFVVPLAALGCSVTRIHSDAGMEFCNAPFRAWCRDKGFHKTNTGGDRFKANPHAESLIGIVKGCARTLMIDAGVAKDQWPYAVRYASRQRFSHMAKLLGWKMSPVVPFGAQVYVRQRSWRLGKRAEWNPRVIKASVLAPARELSQGYLVRTAEGE